MHDLLEVVRAAADAAAADGAEAQYPLLVQTFAAQAGAMVTLANVTAVLIASSSGHGRIGVSSAGLDTWAVGLLDMLLRRRLRRGLGNPT